MNTHVQDTSPLPTSPRDDTVGGSPSPVRPLGFGSYARFWFFPISETEGREGERVVRGGRNP